MRRLGTFLVFPLLACGAGSAEPPSAATAELRAEVVEALEDATRVRWQGLESPFGTPAELEPQVPLRLPVARTRSEALLRWLDRTPGVFRIEQLVRNLRLESESTDELRMTHVRFRAHVGDVPVLNGEVLAHFNEDGELESMDSHLDPRTFAVDPRPTLSKEEATHRAQEFVRGLVGGYKLRREESASLTVLDPDDAPPRLVYHVQLPLAGDRLANMEVFVDAHEGAVVDSFDSLASAITGKGRGVFGDVRTLNVTQNQNIYELIDKTRTPNGIWTCDCKNGSDVPCDALTSRSPNDWDSKSAAPGAGVDAHYYLGLVYDYFKEHHGRLGIDGKDGYMVANVHYQSKLNNAFWDGKQMIFGDSDGQTYRPFAASLHVVAHELTHGVTASSSGLIYRNQSGALNEALSDIFGVFIKHVFEPAEDPKDDWLIGTEVTKDNTALRDMEMPGRNDQPSHMSRFRATAHDNGGVHWNSGIVNNAAFLMTMGGTHDVSKVVIAKGIGYEKAEKVWYRASTNYFTATTNFEAAAKATLRAARDLKLSSEEQNAIECAWIGTGVLSGASKCKTAGRANDDGDDNQGLNPEVPTRSRRVSTQAQSCQVGPGLGSDAGSNKSSGLVALGLVGLWGAARRRPPR